MRWDIRCVVQVVHILLEVISNVSWEKGRKSFLFFKWLSRIRQRFDARVFEQKLKGI